MKLDIGGVETIQAPVDVLWKALNDPTVLTRCIPGCKTMTEIAPDAYKVEMQLRVAAVGGSFEGEIALSDKEPRTRAASRSPAPARWATATAARASRSNRRDRPRRA
jgi:carbon monoxide dehydrogenase subunit G